MWILTLPYKSSEHPPPRAPKQVNVSPRNPRSTTTTNTNNKTPYRERLVPMTQRETESADGVWEFPWLESNGARLSWVLRAPCGLLDLNAFPHSWLSASLTHQTLRGVRSATEEWCWHAFTSALIPTVETFLVLMLLFCAGWQKRNTVWFILSREFK